MKQFREFVNSPFFNKNKNVAALLNALKKYQPDYNSKNMSEELIYKKVFEGKFDYFKIRNTMSDLHALGMEFLSLTGNQKNLKSYDKRLLEELRARNLDSTFLKTIKSYDDSLDTGFLNDSHFLMKSELTLEKLYFNIPKEPYSRIEYHQQWLNQFLNFSLISLLKRYSLMLHEEKLTNVKYDLKMLDEVLAYMNTADMSGNPAALVYYNIVMLQRENDSRYFFELKNLKKKHFEKLDIEDRYNLFLHMATFCADSYNLRCTDEFAREHFLLSKENFDNGTIVLGKILYPDFLNHVKIAVRVDEFEWAEMYIEKFRDELTDEKVNTLNFCRAYILYKKGNIEDALEIFSKTSFPDFILKIQVKIFMLQIYFEKKFYEQALSLIDSMKHLLKRETTAAEDFKNSFSVYLRITYEMVKILSGVREKAVKGEIEKLKSEVNAMSFNYFGIKMWLERQLVRESGIVNRES